MKRTSGAKMRHLDVEKNGKKRIRSHRKKNEECNKELIKVDQSTVKIAAEVAADLKKWNSSFHSIPPPNNKSVGDELQSRQSRQSRQFRSSSNKISPSHVTIDLPSTDLNGNGKISGKSNDNERSVLDDDVVFESTATSHLISIPFIPPHVPPQYKISDAYLPEAYLANLQAQKDLIDKLFSQCSKSSHAPKALPHKCLEELTNSQLQNILKSKCLPIYGKKSDLIERLREQRYQTQRNQASCGHLGGQDIRSEISLRRQEVPVLDKSAEHEYHYSLKTHVFPPSQYSIEINEEMTTSILRDLLKQRCLPIYGKKSDLIARLKQYIGSNHIPIKNSSSASNNKLGSQNPNYLVDESRSHSIFISQTH